MKLISTNVFSENDKIYTLTNDKKSIYGEKVIKKDNQFYREWNPFRSKISAALMRKLKKLNINKDSNILYLGCASGTTVSHISDIIKKGIVFAVDISQKEMMSLYLKLKKRDNVAPIFANASNPESYRDNISNVKIDFIIQDIASINQIEILIKNAEKYLVKNGEIYLSLKTKSISQNIDPTEILESAKLELQKHFTLLKSVNLRKYEDNHWLLHLKKDF